MSSSSEGNQRSITLTWTVSHYVAGQTNGVRVRIDVTATNNMTDYVFAHQLLPADPVSGNREKAFDHICSPVDIEEYPTVEPTSTGWPAWFRLNYADVFLRSMHEAEQFIDLVQADVSALKDTLDTMDELLEGGEVTL